jgi:hypothetical protein
MFIPIMNITMLQIIRICNKMCYLVIFGLIFYILFYFSSLDKRNVSMVKHSIKNNQFLSEDSSNLKRSAKVSMKASEPKYTRNIFHPVIHGVYKIIDVNALRSSLINKIRIVGIVLGDQPQVAIEVIKSQETLFLNLGDVIEDVRINGIFENKVIMEYKTNKIEMSL